MDYVTNAQLCEIVRSNLGKVPHAVDGVIGIPRGGVFVGAILSEYLNVPLYTVEGFMSGVDIGAGKAGAWLRPRGTSVYIVVDDSASTGASFAEARHRLSGVPSCDFVYIAAVCDDRDVPDSVDIVLSHVREFRLFELNLFRTPHVSSMVFDIDGVLCDDPEPGLDLDEERYLEHIRHARPRIPLAYPAMAICTHRLLRYAEPTIGWLAENGIGYGKLYMLDIPDVREKIAKSGSHEVMNMKSDAYMMHPEAILFVESSMEESERIARNTGRPVLCTDTNTLVQGR